MSAPITASTTSSSAAAPSAALQLWSKVLQGTAIAAAVATASFVFLPGLGRSVYYLQWEYPVPAPPAVHRYVVFSFGLLAAVTAGWMAQIAMLARGPLLVPGPAARGTYRAITTSVLGWFLVDNTISVATGGYANVALNVAFLAALAVPLLKLRPLVHAKTTSE